MILIYLKGGARYDLSSLYFPNFRIVLWLPLASLTVCSLMAFGLMALYDRFVSGKTEFNYKRDA